MLTCLGDNLSHEQAHTYGLVLTSSGLSYTVRGSDDAWEIWVDASIYDKARYLVAQYRWENPQEPLPEDSAPDGREIITEVKTHSGIWVALLLLACHVIAGVSHEKGRIVSQCGSSAAHILDGELYRTATSLLLHADYGHLAGNMAGIAILGTAVCKVTGTGVGWLMILVSGMLGNLANAVLFKTGHNSIGASTAVFGAVGILAAYQFYTKIRAADRHVKAWLPLAAGLALLGLLGSSEHTDITAHLFGFMAGICLGLVYAARFNRVQERTRQNYCLAVAILIVAFSCLRAFHLL